MLVQVVKHDLGVLGSMHVDDDAHALAIAFISHVRNSLESSRVYQGCYLGNESGLARLVRDLRKHNALALLVARLDVGAPPDRDVARPAFVDGRQRGLR